MIVFLVNYYGKEWRSIDELIKMPKSIYLGNTCQIKVGNYLPGEIYTIKALCMPLLLLKI